MLRQIRERHELLWALTLKELKVRYKRATLGILWTVLNPLTQGQGNLSPYRKFRPSPHGSQALG